jgi:hypothetical protein
MAGRNARVSFQALIIGKNPLKEKQKYQPAFAKNW